MNTYTVGQIVFARYNSRCKWKEGRIWQIDESRTLPYGIETICTSKYHGQQGEYYPAFRVKSENLKPSL